MGLTLKNVAVIGDELAVVWSDDSESYYPLETLRRACPCAVCQGEPDGFRPAEKPTIEYRPNCFVLRTYSMVGNYGLQPTWGDGHQTGIFSFEYLRKIAAGLPGIAPTNC
jgi:DUF971 family protein